MKLPSWLRLVCGGLVVMGLILLVVVYWEWLSGGESGSTTLRNVALMVAGVIALWFAYWRSRVADRQAETSHRGLLNERYQKGAEMLGSDLLAVRLGGIYALQRLAEENAEQYHIQIMRLLCAFARHPTGDKDRDENNNGTDTERQPDNKDYPIREDVEAAMMTIGTRSSVGIELEQEKHFHLDLSGANLNGANLNGAELTSAHLNEANLIKAHLNGADLNSADLNEARLNGANLNEAYLRAACLNGANLNGAHLNEANLSNVHLNGASLKGARLKGANLITANLNGANLDGANLNEARLNGANLNEAYLRAARLNGANLNGAHLNEANLFGVYLDGADLTRANLTTAMLYKAKGLTQQQLDQAVAVSNSPPELGGLRDAKTGDLLKWRGKEPDDDR